MAARTELRASSVAFSQHGESSWVVEKTLRILIVISKVLKIFYQKGSRKFSVHFWKTHQSCELVFPPSTPG